MRWLVRVLRTLVISSLLAVVFVVGLVAMVNVLVNVALAPLINQKPERLRITWQVAWMIIPGEVHVRGLRIRTQGNVDQWEIAAQSASGTVDLRALWYQRFEASNLVGDGVTFRYRVRHDSRPPDAPAEAATPAIEGALADLELGPAADLEPPIAGLANPPDPRPEDVYGPPGRPWLVALDIASIDGVELWMGDYRLSGPVHVVGTLLVEGPYLDADVGVAVADASVLRGRETVASNVGGTIAVRISGMDRDLDRGDDAFQAFEARATLSADAHDLQFLKFYLDSAPWLTLDGEGHVSADVAFSRGELLAGTRVVADFPDLLAGFMSYDILGQGRVEAQVHEVDGVPESRVDVTFRDFAITGRDAGGVLVTGEGFHLAATSPDVGVNRPFTYVDAAFDLPESEIVDIGPYNEFLPRDIGFSIQGGHGTLRGQLFATTRDNVARGDLWVRGREVRARYESFDVRGGLDLHVHVGSGDLDAGRYDLSGTTLSLSHMRFVSRLAPEGGSRDWSAAISMPRAIVTVGAAQYLDAELRMRCSDSNPFVALFTERGNLPKWAGPLLEVEDVEGSMRLRLGLDSLRIGPARVAGGHYELLMQMRKNKRDTTGDLYARYGKISLGLGLHGGPVHVEVLGARKWFDAQPALD